MNLQKNMHLFPFLKTRSASPPSATRAEPLLCLRGGPVRKAHNKCRFLCPCNLICKNLRSVLGNKRDDRVPSRNCRGIASQRTAAPARPGLHPQQRSPRCLAPPARCPGAAPGTTRPRPAVFALGCLREASQTAAGQIWATSVPTDSTAPVPQKGHPREKRSRHPLAAERSQLGHPHPSPAPRGPLTGQEVGSDMPLWKPL